MGEGVEEPVGRGDVWWNEGRSKMSWISWIRWEMLKTYE